MRAAPKSYWNGVVDKEYAPTLHSVSASNRSDVLSPSRLYVFYLVTVANTPKLLLAQFLQQALGLSTSDNIEN